MKKYYIVIGISSFIACSIGFLVAAYQSFILTSIVAAIFMIVSPLGAYIDYKSYLKRQ